MSYKEFLLIYLTLFSGLACTNVLQGLGIIFKEWRRIRIGWEYFFATGAIFLTLTDLWFHSFFFPYGIAAENILIFITFVTPSGVLFLCTLVLFPEPSNNQYDYVKFFQRSLRIHMMLYGLFIICLLVQILIIRFMLIILLPVLVSYLAFCVIIYIFNSVKLYKILVLVGFSINLIRLLYELSFLKNDL